MTAGSITTPLYIRPIRYTPSRRDAIRVLTGMGMLNSRSLSLARYSPE